MAVPDVLGVNFPALLIRRSVAHALTPRTPARTRPRTNGMRQQVTPQARHITARCVDLANPSTMWSASGPTLARTTAAPRAHDAPSRERYRRGRTRSLAWAITPAS